MLLTSALARAQAPASAPVVPPSSAEAPPTYIPAAAPVPGRAPARAPKRAAPRPQPGPRPGLADSVWLRDGTRLRGTLLRVEPDNYVLLLGIEGVRTIPWRSINRVENAAEARAAAGKAEPSVALLAPCCADELASEAARPAEDAWADVSLGWDLRAEGVSLFKHYTLVDRGVWHGGEGWGGAASVSLHFRGPAWLVEGTGSRWVELELGAGDSLHSVAWKEGAEYQTRFLENQTSLILGAHFASGRWHPEGGGAPWSGVVVGLAWVPTYVRFFGSTDFDATGKFHPGGLRMTLDWGRIAPGRKGRVPGLRAAFTWLPYVGDLPTAISFGLGAVFY
ncbi:MAG: hypothetical protein ABI895_02165 [Deltaproteobacteria bacterium]